MIAALTSSMFLAPSDSTRNAVMRRAGGAAEAGAAADEAEDALGLPRVVDVVGQRPELADQQDAEDQRRQVEARPRPSPAPIVREQEPEQHAAAPAMPACVTGIVQRRGTAAHQPWCSPA